MVFGNSEKGTLMLRCRVLQPVISEANVMGHSVECRTLQSQGEPKP